MKRASDRLAITATRSAPLRREPSRRILAAGRSLPAREAQGFGSEFGHDFSHVRIHTDDRAAQAARAVGAAAFTFGSHIVFAPGRYRPQQSQGRALLAHELAHVVQQEPRSPGGPARAPVDSRHEQCADEVADAIARHRPADAVVQRLRSALGRPALQPKIEVTQEMWTERFEIEIRKYKLALEHPDLSVRKWSLEQAVMATNLHLLGTKKSAFQPPPEYVSKAQGREAAPEKDKKPEVEGTLGANYVDNFSDWHYDVNKAIQTEKGGEWEGASPWLTLEFGAKSIDVDMRSILDRTLSRDEIVDAFKNRYTREGIVFPKILSPSTAANVAAAKQAARAERDGEFGFTNSLALLGLSVGLGTGLSALPLARAPLASALSGAGLAGGAKRAQQTAKALRPQASLSRAIVGAAKQGGVKDIIVKGVALRISGVTRSGKELIVRVSHIVNQSGIRGIGRGQQVWAALEQGAKQAARESGATSVRIVGELITNPKAKEFLAKRGYTWIADANGIGMTKIFSLQ